MIVGKSDVNNTPFFSVDSNALNAFRKTVPIEQKPKKELKQTKNKTIVDENCQ